MSIEYRFSNNKIIDRKVILDRITTLPIYFPDYLSFSLHLLLEAQMEHAEHFAPQQEMACLNPTFGPGKIAPSQSDRSSFSKKVFKKAASTKDL